MFNSIASFSDEQMFSILESTLEKYSYTNENSITDLSELDGFLTAIVSTPSMIMPSRWMPEIWRGSQPEWENQRDFEDFMHAAVQLMNHRSLLLTAEPESFAAIFNETIDVDNAKYTIVDEWCSGYMRGVKLDAEEFFKAPEFIQKELAKINLFADEQFDDMFCQISDAKVEEFQSQVEPAARNIHAFFLKQRAEEVLRDNASSIQVTRSTPKLGRNDPCHCGSGKKFKKCCLKPLELVKK